MASSAGRGFNSHHLHQNYIRKFLLITTINLLLIINLFLLPTIRIENNFIVKNQKSIIIIFLGGGNAKLYQFEILSIHLLQNDYTILKKDFPFISNEEKYYQEFRNVLENIEKNKKIIIVAHSAGANIALSDEKNTKILMGMNFEYLPENSTVINGIFDEIHPPWETLKITKKNYNLIWANHISELINPQSLKDSKIVAFNKTTETKIILYILLQTFLIFFIIFYFYKHQKMIDFFIFLLTLLITSVFSLNMKKDIFIHFYAEKIDLLISLVLIGIILKRTNINITNFISFLIIFLVSRYITSLIFSLPFFMNINKFQNVDINSYSILTGTFYLIIGNIYFVFLNSFNTTFSVIFLILLLTLISLHKDIILKKMEEYYKIFKENENRVFLLLSSGFIVAFILNFLSYYYNDFFISDLSRMIQFLGKELGTILISLLIGRQTIKKC